MGVLPLKNPIEIYICCWEWGKYLGAEAIEQGVDVCVSSWTRIAPNTLPAIVITSYSIHYTKLYEKGKALRALLSYL